MLTDEPELKCEICGATATVVEVAARGQYTFCRQHAGPDHGGWLLQETLDGRRIWVNVGQRYADSPRLPDLPPGDWRDWS